MEQAEEWAGDVPAHVRLAQAAAAAAPRVPGALESPRRLFPSPSSFVTHSLFLGQTPAPLPKAPANKLAEMEEELRKEEAEASGSDAGDGLRPPPRFPKDQAKRPRLVFTDIQKRTLQVGGWLLLTCRLLRYYLWRFPLAVTFSGW